MKARFQLETYTLEVPMDHSLVMNVNQPLGNTFQLDGSEFSAKKGCRDFRRSTYEPDPVYVRMCLREVIDIPIYHPVRYHGEVALGHHNSSEWQDVWVLEGLPHNNLLAELLRTGLLVSWCAGGGMMSDLLRGSSVNHCSSKS